MSTLAYRYSVTYQQSRLKWMSALWIAGLVWAAVLLGLLLLGGPDPAFIGWLIYGAGIVAIVAQPRYGIYLILFMTLVADGILMPWFPFNKNFSSPESLLYLNDALIFSPQELYIVLTALSWGARLWARRQLKLQEGALGLPVLLFIGAIMMGLVYGIGRGGSLNIALWEARPIFYLALMYFLTLNLIEERGQVSILMWAIMLALFIEGIAGNLYFFVTLGMDLGKVEAITEHSAAIHMNTLYVMIIGVWMFRGSPAKRAILPLFAPFVGLTYLATQRRASFVVMAVALVLIAITLYRENRRQFWIIVPICTVIGGLYLAVFWNSSGALGLPARGIKSIFANESSAEYSSNIYRVIENVNTSFTIHQSPLFGVGFGQKFYVLMQMPDISFFDWWEYITHNSILWIWMKAGLPGFLTMTFMAGSIVVTGAQVMDRISGGDLKATALSMVLYVIMHFVYAYVDMSWDAQSMVYVGTAAGLLAGLTAIAARPVPPLPIRWRWQESRMPVRTGMPVRTSGTIDLHNGDE